MQSQQTRIHKGAKKPRSHIRPSDITQREWPTQDNRITGFQCLSDHVLLYWRTPERGLYSALSFGVDEWVFFRQTIWKKLCETPGPYSAVWFGSKPETSYRVDKVDGVVAIKYCECTPQCSKVDVASPCALEDQLSKDRFTLPDDENDWFRDLPTSIMLYEGDSAALQVMFAEVDMMLGCSGGEKVRVRRALFCDPDKENIGPRVSVSSV